jgi:hypothetical protein
MVMKEWDPGMSHPGASIPVFSQPSWITHGPPRSPFHPIPTTGRAIAPQPAKCPLPALLLNRRWLAGDPYGDAHSGPKKIAQSTSEDKTPFASGKIAASRHRGAQFVNSSLHEGAFPSNNTGDPYADGWKRTHHHYQRRGSRIEGTKQFRPADAPKRDLPVRSPRPRMFIISVTNACPWVGRPRCG